MNMQPSSTSSTFFQPKYMEQKKNIVKKLLPFEDNVALSEEEDIMLAQCIRSGIPKVSCLSINKIKHSLTDIKDQIKNYIYT